mgnify:CR=1 FL=1
MKKLLSVFLAALLAFSCAGLFALAADGTVVNVYMIGSQEIYKFHEDGTKTEIFDDGDYLSDLLPNLISPALKGITTGDWTEYSQTVLNGIMPAFEGYTPNPDGTMPENTGIEWSWSYETLENRLVVAKNGENLRAYYFQPDVRYSPLVIADQLNEYIEAVKQKTGAVKINLLSRCEGCSVALAYLMKYEQPKGFSGVNSFILLDGAMNGIGYMDAIFSGNVVLPNETVARWARTYQLDELTVEEGSTMEKLMAFARDFVQMLYETHAMSVLTMPLQSLYDQLKYNTLQPIIKAWWGVSLTHVSCVNAHFEDYLSYVFNEEGDAEKYANIIALAKDFHYNVQLHMDELILDMVDHGVPVNIIGEYGFQQYPLYADAELIGEHQTGLREQAFGPTVSAVDKTLDEKYINIRVAEGKGKYISPDKQIDASTCLLPDNTWFIKNVDHSYTDAVHLLVAAIVNNPGCNIDTLGVYGQFNNAKGHFVLEPLQEVNENDVQWNAAEPGAAGENVLSMIGSLLVRVINYVRGIIQGIVAHAKGLA